MMKLGFAFRTMCLFVCVTVATGCGTFGDTKVVKVQPSKNTIGPMAKIEVGSFRLADDASRLDANAFGDFAAAAKGLPEDFRSMHALSVEGWIGFATYGQRAAWTWVHRPEGVNWVEYLKTSPAAQP
jgi:hypothetical protein